MIPLSIALAATALILLADAALYAASPRFRALTHRATYGRGARR